MTRRDNTRARKILCRLGFHQRLETTYPHGKDYYCTYCGHRSLT